MKAKIPRRICLPIVAAICDAYAPGAYFGLWWSAADPANQMDFYLGTSLLGTFNPTTASDALDNSA
jgi:hypothetical protein